MKAAIPRIIIPDEKCNRLERRAWLPFSERKTIDSLSYLFGAAEHFSSDIFPIHEKLEPKD